LIARGHAVWIVDNFSTGKPANVPPKAELVEMDLSDPAQYRRLERVPLDAVFHLAAQASGEASFADPWQDYNSHVTATFLLLDLCRRRGVRRFLYASSMSVYGDPQYLPVDELHPTAPKSYYGAGKLAAEAYVRLHSTLGLNATIFRMFSVYGPNQNLANKMQGMVSIYLSFMLENQPIVVKGSKDRFRDFIYIDDVVQAWLLAWENAGTFGKTYNLGTGRRTTVEALLRHLTECFGRHDYPLVYATNTPGDQFGIVAQMDKLGSELGWLPTHDVTEGLSKMVRSYTERTGLWQ
jgi:UDP-glucose 4-epimerase